MKFIIEILSKAKSINLTRRPYIIKVINWLQWIVIKAKNFHPIGEFLSLQNFHPKMITITVKKAWIPIINCYQTDEFSSWFFISMMNFHQNYKWFSSQMMKFIDLWNKNWPFCQVQPQFQLPLDWDNLYFYTTHPREVGIWLKIEILSKAKSINLTRRPYIIKVINWL